MIGRHTNQHHENFSMAGYSAIYTRNNQPFLFSLFPFPISFFKEKRSGNGNEEKINFPLSNFLSSPIISILSMIESIGA
jgi:hypothetical protein